MQPIRKPLQGTFSSIRPVGRQAGGMRLRKRRLCATPRCAQPMRVL